MNTLVHLSTGQRYAAGVRVPLIMGLLTSAPDGTIDIGTTAVPNWSNVVAYKKGAEPAGFVPPGAASTDYDITIVGTWSGPDDTEIDLQIYGDQLFQGSGAFTTPEVVWMAPVSGLEPSTSSSSGSSTTTQPKPTAPPCEWWNVPCWPTWAKVLGGVAVVGGIAGIAYSHSE